METVPSIFVHKTHVGTSISKFPDNLQITFGAG